MKPNSAITFSLSWVEVVHVEYLRERTRTTKGRKRIREVCLERKVKRPKEALRAKCSERANRTARRKRLMDKKLI